MPHYRRLGSFALLLLISASATAATLNEIVVTASRTEQPLREIAGAVSVLDQESLTLIDHTHINEALARAAGVWISRGNGQEHLTAIRSPVLTGAGSCGAFLMTQDGIPLRAPGFCNVNELFEGPTELASRVEVLKGPGSAIHGSDAMHGVVNILTPEVMSGQRSISFLGGPDDYFRAQLSVSTDTLRVDLSGTTDGGYKDDSGFGQQKLLFKHRYEGSERSITTTFAYTNLNQETSGFIQGPEVYRDPDLKRTNPNPEAYRDARSYRLVSSIEQSLAGGDLTLKPYLRQVEMDFIQHFLPGQALEENGHDSVGISGTWVDAESQWLLGFELDLTDGYLKEFQPGPTGRSAFLNATIPTGQHYDYQVDAVLAGLFIQRSIALSEAVTLTTGLRYQHVEYDYDNRMLDGNTREDGTPCGFGGCRFSRPADRTDSFANWSPKLGLSWELDNNHQVFGLITRGFRAPQATELYRLQGGQNVADIDPVKLDAVEFGLRGLQDKTDYSISLFAMEKDNFIFRDTNRQNVDNGETSHLGAELELGYSLTPAWRFNLAMTWARHRYENNPALVSSPIAGNDIDTAPRTLGAAQLTWRPLDRARIEMEWVHIGEYFQDPQNQQVYGGHDLLHLRSSWQATDSLRVQARIMNLTDEDYAERADFAFGNDRYFVGTPRSVFVGFELSL